MDLESYESMDVNWPADEDLASKLKELQKDPGKMSVAQLEYWKLAGKTLITRIILN
jgi:translation elongation factor P/translation initiation factor 5A